MMIFYTDAFRYILTQIATLGTHKQAEVARFLLAAEESNQALDKYTLIDKTDKNDMISYAQVGKIARARGLSDEELPGYRVGADDSFWKEGRTAHYAVGRWVRHVYVDVHNSQIGGPDLEDFVNAYKSQYDLGEKGLSGFELVSGEDIRKWYLESNYGLSGGQLWSSCMRHKRCQNYLDIYVKNPDVCSLLILKGDDPDKIIGRALVWKSRSGSLYMDRIYTARDNDMGRFIEYAKQNGISRSERGMSVSVGARLYNSYPYMDTFVYYSPVDGLLSPDPGGGAGELKLCNTDGSADGGNVVWSDYHERNIDADEAVWCDDAHDYVLRDCAVWLEYMGMWVSEEADTVYSGYSSESYYTEDTVWSECMIDYIFKDEAVEFRLNREGKTDFCGERMSQFYVEVDGEYYSKDNYRKDPYGGWYFVEDEGRKSEVVRRLREELGVDEVGRDVVDGLLREARLGEQAEAKLREIAMRFFRSISDIDEKCKIMQLGLYVAISLDVSAKSSLPSDFVRVFKAAAAEVSALAGLGEALPYYERLEGVTGRHVIRKMLGELEAFDLSLLPDRLFKAVELRSLLKR